MRSIESTATSLPFRWWCKQCIMGRGMGTHHTTTGSESLVLIIGLDYCFIAKERLRRRDELAAELKARAHGQLVECLVVRCFDSKSTFAHVVPQKGDDEDHYYAKIVAADVEWLGDTRVILKTIN